METLWFMIVAFMLVGYVILDGFDIGAGIIHYIVGRNSDERNTIISAIGPVWDGNEVWLLATGGTLYFAFPALYAASFSGFYLPLMCVLWLLIFRALGIELRHQLDNPMWHSIWDFSFTVSSALLAIFFGAALGNVIRGVPLNEEGFFFLPFFTDFTVSSNPGILDWFTVIAGLVAYTALTVHGATYLAVKTEGVLQMRARKTVFWVWFLLVGLTVISLISVVIVRPEILDNYKNYPIGWLIPLLVIASLIGIKIFSMKGADVKAFISSGLYLAGMLGGAVFGLYPNVLPAINPQNSLTIYNASAPAYGLGVGIIWWSIGILLALGYFFYLYRTFRGKVKFDAYGEH